MRGMALAMRWVLRACLALMLVLAVVWGGLHFWIVPRIADFRPQLQTWASQALGVPVRVGDLVAQSNGWVPSIEIKEVELLNPQGTPALRLPRVLVALSARSVLRGGFEQLYIDHPMLEVRRTAQGRILVAGLDVGEHSIEGDSASADWLFAQSELVIQGGSVRWVDEQRAAPPLELRQLDLIVRNSHRRHELRLDATPPSGWGQRFEVQARFRRPFFSTHPGRWNDWSGQVYAMFKQVDASRLSRHVTLGPGIDVRQGQGALRAWVDVERGQWQGGTLDMALSPVTATLGPGLQALDLRYVSGRISGRYNEAGLDIHTENLQFQTQSGVRWPGGNVVLSSIPASGDQPARGELRASRLDLATLSQLARSLPLGSTTHALLTEHPVQGLVEDLNASWQGSLAQPSHYELRSRISALAVAARPASAPASAGAEPPVGSPGLRGASVTLDMNQDGGKVQLQLSKGALEFPGVFEDPALLFDRLSLDAQWQVRGDSIVVPKFSTRFANADTEGELSGSWRTSDPARAPSGSRFPGEIDLQGKLIRADGSRVWRYLPLVIPDYTRSYLKQALLKGQASNMAVRIKGDLYHVPYGPPRVGEFRFAGQVRGGTYAFVPPGIQPVGQRPWPVLTDLNGELVIDRASLRVNQASARLQGQPHVQVTQAEAQIPNLMENTTVKVQVDAKGPLADMLGSVNQSAVGDLLGGVLAQASATGDAQLRLNLNLPLHDINSAKVQGSVQLAGNDLRITPATPLLGKARGQIQFNESGFTLVGTQAQALGGEVRLDGGMRGSAPAGSSAVQVRAQGQFSAEGLRQAPELGLPARLARYASGSAPYSLNLGFRRGVAELNVQSSLQGLAMHLPAPLAKSADSVLPLSFSNALLPEALAVSPSGSEPPLLERMQIDLGSNAQVSYVRDLGGAEPRVVRGAIALGLAGGETVATPEQGVAANVRLPRLDADAWEDAIEQLSTAIPTAGGSSASVQGYLPTMMAVRTDALIATGRQLGHVVIGGNREGLNWRANVDADQFSGYVEYRQPSPSNAGRVYARLARLVLAPSTAAEVENLLDQQPSAIPALDIEVDDFELRGKKLGRLDIEASNNARDWRLSKLSLQTPEARLSASGQWLAAGTVRDNKGEGKGEGKAPRRTQMTFKLDIRDAGALLTRLGMKDVVRRGQGSIDGQIHWQGSPLSPDVPSLSGQVKLDVENGQFLKAEPGLAKLIGVLSLQALPRRLTLDFRDVFSSGFAFDLVRGDVDIQHGVASTHNLQMQGVNAAVLMDGSADIGQETQNLRVVVVPEINAGTASLIASVVNPAVGISTMLAQLFLRRPLAQATTQVFDITGPWAEPRISKVTQPTLPATAASAAASPPASAQD